MFDYPLPIPHDTLYEELGLEPEATTDEIQSAKRDRRQEIEEQLSKIGFQLNDIYEAVPELRTAEARVSDLRLENPNSELINREAELRKAREALDKLENRALAHNHEFKHLRTQYEEFSRKLEELPTIPLFTPGKRLNYDREHPPLELFKLADCRRNDLFDRNRRNIALTFLRDELSAFLTGQGEVVYHPSDLTRDDFYADFSYASLLDGI